MGKNLHFAYNSWRKLEVFVFWLTYGVEYPYNG